MRRADYIRQNTGNSFVKAMTDDELTMFLMALDNANGKDTATQEKYTNWLQEEIK